MPNFKNVKSFYFFLIYQLAAQPATSQEKFLRLSFDNDAFVPSSRATDWGYTSGIRADLFYKSTARLNALSWFNKSGGADQLIIKSWGLSQTIIAPQKTSLAIPDQNDYPYSGALVFNYAIHSSNEKKKMIIRSEWTVGVLGPASFGKQTHVFFHRLINDPKPMGWDHQLPTDLLINHSIDFEKYLTQIKGIMMTGGASIRCGTMHDDISLRLRIQAGKNHSPFKGQYKKNFSEKVLQIGFHFQGSAGLILYNALLQGGLFNSQSPLHDKNSNLGTSRDIEHFVGNIEGGILFSLKKIAASFTVRLTSSDLDNYGQHVIGNITLYKTL